MLSQPTDEHWTVINLLFDRALEVPRAQWEWWLGRQTSSYPPEIVEQVRKLLAGVSTAGSIAPSLPNDAESGGMHPFIDKVLLNRFRLSSHLGSGAMGDVYGAFDGFKQRQVAIKTIRPALSNLPAFRACLMNEASSASQVAHENLCQLYDLHEDPVGNEGSPLLFFAMQKLEGDTLAKRLSQGRLEYRQAYPIARDIAEGLWALHQKNLVHRDLKPSNVFLEWLSADTERAVITDFGLCLSEGSALYEALAEFGAEAAVGTPAYMAPEQRDGRGATYQSDIYAFGVVLFEMVTGRLPFEGQTSLAIGLRSLQERPPEPRSLVADLPERWNSTLLACLAEDPAERPENVKEVARALAEEEPSRRTITRRQVFSGVAALAAAGVAGTVVWQEREAAKRHSPEAKIHYQVASEYIRQSLPSSILRGINELQSAVKIEPNYADAWADLAEAYCLASNFSAMPSRTALPAAWQAATQALKLDSNLGKAKTASAYVLACDMRHWRSADSVFRSAINLDPSDPTPRGFYASFLGRCCEFKRAVSMAQDALNMDAGSLHWSYRLGTELLRGRQFEQARDHMEQFVLLHPAEGAGFSLLARANEWLGRFDDAENNLKIADRLPDNSETLSYWATLFAARGQLALSKTKADAICQLWEAQKAETNVYLYALGALNRAGVHNVSEIAEVMQTGIRRNDETVLAAASNIYLQQVRNHPQLEPLFRAMSFA